MFAKRWLPIIFLLASIRTASSLDDDEIEDITSEHTFHRDNIVSQVDVSRSYGTIGERPRKAKNQDILQQYFNSKKGKRTENTSQFAHTQYAVSTEAPTTSIGSSYGKLGGILPKVTRDPPQNRQVIAGIPDTNDPCFRRYPNCIIVNAQPYERRSSMSLLQCKAHCLHSQTGVYSCRSFVYDNLNQVCDLFPHVGDQAPARLLKFQSRDYFEPSHALQCLNYLESSTTTTTTTPASTTYYATEPPDRIPTLRASKVDRRDESGDIVKTLVDDLIEQNQPDLPELTTMRCPAGKRISFLRTEGFELFKNDDITIQVGDVNECVAACEKNNIEGQPLDCRSFDFSGSTCSFSAETAVPVGNGQLQQRNDSFYYEKICVSEKSTRNCSPTFTRFPQMVLVGFAEAVADTTSFESCFEQCLDSFGTFGFNCTSGMYFFEEAQLNCILNSEDRHTQSELFAEENTDIVDYFEIGCQKPLRRRAHAAKTFVMPEKLVVASETQTEWSKCEDGLQHRRRDCHDGDCGLQSRHCEEDKKTIPTQQSESDDLPTHDDVAKVKADIRRHGLRCAPDICCPVFSNCSVGLRLNSTMKRLEWCKRPCTDKRRKQL
uniref:PAN domain protein n=1 Tax=Haemonchus contortus TaxID=6289 RepID=A0A7I4YCY4_HAECO